MTALPIFSNFDLSHAAAVPHLRSLLLALNTEQISFFATGQEQGSQET